MKEFHVIWYLLIGLRIWLLSEKVYFLILGFNGYWNPVKQYQTQTQTDKICVSVPINFPWTVSFSHLFLLAADWSTGAQCSPLIGHRASPQPWLSVRTDIMMAAWVNIKMLAPIIIKYHFLFSFTHFVVLIASLCLMQTFTLRNKERARNAEVAEERESAGIFYHFQLETVLVDFWLHLGPRE